MKYQVFADFDAYEDAIQHAAVRMTLHRRDRPRWAVGQMSLGRMHLQWGTSGGGMVTEGEILPGGYALFVPLNHWSTNGVNGSRLNEGSMMVASAGAEFCISADGWNDWLTLFVPTGNLGKDTLSIGEGITPACRVVHLGNHRLRLVRHRIRELIKSSVGGEQHSAVEAAELELHQLAKSAVMHALFDEDRGLGRPMLDRQGVVRMVTSAIALDAAPEKTARVRDLIDAAKVSERTLHRAFQDWFGISPVRYLRLRQLHSVRDALLAANPETTTVTDVFVRHDIRQFGRFAGVYRTLFGELPSQTLSRLKG
ncbi:AraC family transcriptional regulator [Roseiconus nitratireducens]|nr:helix-turn-helix domain-containing protein [Roseiconus nitratireducens]